MLKKNVGISVVGQGISVGLALVTVPVFTWAFGVERFAFYLFVQAVLPFFGLFDFGFGRWATISTAREYAGSADDRMIFTRLSALALSTSALMSVACYFLLPITISYFGDAKLSRETDDALVFMALLPLVTSAQCLVTYRTEAMGRFATSNIIQIVGGVLTAGLPILFNAYEPGLPALFAGVLSARVLQLLASLFFAGIMPRVPRFGGDLASLRPMVVDILWLSATALCTTAISSVDRLLIGFLQSPRNLYHYATPNNVASRLGIVASATARAVAPKLSIAEPGAARELAFKANEGLLALMLAGTIPLSFLANDLLALWINADFAVEAAPVFRIALIGLLGLVAAQVPATLLQTTGGARKIVKLHVIEVGPLIGAVWLASHVGIVAVAAVICARSALDGLGHMWLAGFSRRRLLSYGGVVGFAVAVAAAASALAQSGWMVRGAACAITLLALVLSARWLLPEVHGLVHDNWRSLRPARR